MATPDFCAVLVDGTPCGLAYVDERERYRYCEAGHATDRVRVPEPAGPVLVRLSDDPRRQQTPAGKHPPDEHRPEGLRFQTARELAEATPETTDWVVRGLLARGSITELDAKIKVGKTTFLGLMLWAILAGEPFLDQPTECSGVVLLTEERPATIRAMLARCRLLAATNLYILSLHDARDREWPAVVATSEYHARLVGANVIVVDTLPRWAKIPDDGENNAGAAAAAIAPLEEAAARGFAVFIVRHDRKAGGEIGDSARGSSAFGGAADIILHLTRANTPGHLSRRTLEGVGRFEEVPESLVIELDGESGYQVLGDVRDVNQQDMRARLLDVLPNADGTPLTEEDLKSIIPGFARSTFQRVRNDLRKEGLIECVPKQGPTHRALGYRLPSIHLPSTDGPLGRCLI